MSTNLENSAVPTDWKRSVFIPVPNKGNAKEWSNFCAIALISDTSKIILKIFQVGFSNTLTKNFQKFKLDLEKAKKSEVKLPTFVGSYDAEAELPILWPPDVKNWFIREDTDAGKDWRQEEKGTTEDEMIEWHHRLDEHESVQALGVGDGQGGLAWFSPWGRKESDTTEGLNWTD